MKCDDCKRSLDPKTIKLIFLDKVNGRFKTVKEVCQKCLDKWWIKDEQEIS